MTSDFATDPFGTLINRLAAWAPGFVAAFLLLLAGLFVARGVRTLLERLLGKARLDDYSAKVGINEILARLGLGKSPTDFLGSLVYWLILLVFFISAANAVGLPAISALLERFMLFLPSVIAALLILFGGTLFARFLSVVTANAAAANGVRGGEFLARAAYAIILVFAVLMALDQLGIETRLVTSSIQILLASAGLACAIAFGLGGKDIAAETLRDFLNKRKA